MTRWLPDPDAPALFGTDRTALSARLSAPLARTPWWRKALDRVVYGPVAWVLGKLGYAVE